MKIEIVDGAILITVPLSALRTAAAVAFDEAWGVEQHDIRVIDSSMFAADVLRELEAEDEDGTTLVHQMLDRAMIRAVEQGSEGISYNG